MSFAMAADPDFGRWAEMADASLLQFASIASALVWPLAAGVAVVAWSKTRSARNARRAVELDGQLKGLYRSIESRRTPERLAMVVDALEEGEELAGGAAAKDKAAAKS